MLRTVAAFDRIGEENAFAVLARATQLMYYPEFLPDAARPRGLPWSSAADRPDGVSETFGTIRYGRLAEILLYGEALTEAKRGAIERYLCRKYALTRPEGP